MKIDCILTSTNLNPLYCEFIPIFINTWKKLLPKTDIKIVLISDHIPNQYQEYSDHLILYKNTKSISTQFVSQYIRLLYPCLLNYDGGVLITDMDMLPMNSKYYVDNIKKYSNNKFIYYRNVLLDQNQIAMCYNIASPKIWSEIFQIFTEDDIDRELENLYSQIEYDGNHGGIGWHSDQINLYQKVIAWSSQTGNFINLHDKDTGYNRLDRPNMPEIDSYELKRIRLGYYSDYHALRPHSEYSTKNELICSYVTNEISLLEKIKSFFTHKICS